MIFYIVCIWLCILPSPTRLYPSPLVPSFEWNFTNNLNCSKAKRALCAISFILIFRENFTASRAHLAYAMGTRYVAGMHLIKNRQKCAIVCTLRLKDIKICAQIAIGLDSSSHSVWDAERFSLFNLLFPHEFVVGGGEFFVLWCHFLGNQRNFRWNQTWTRVSVLLFAFYIWMMRAEAETEAA